MKEKMPLTQARIFWFWIPLAAMWLMMAIEHPIMAAVIARLPAPELNLAAFGVTFSLALVVESPVIMLLTAGTALARGRHSYRRLLQFTHLLAGSLTVLHLLIGLTPLFGWVVEGVIGVPPELVQPARQAFLLMTPWSAAIAYRRLWQGVLIRFDRTKVVPLTIGARLITSLVVLSTGLLLGDVPGANMGALALSLGVLMAALAAYLLARPVIQTHLSSETPNDEPLGWRELFDFYAPLALTSLIGMLVQPVLSIGLARAPLPLASLAVWPVVMGVLFLGRSFAFSFQEAVVALLEDWFTYQQLRRFTLWLAMGLSGVFLFMAFTPAARLWFENISGLPPDLARLAISPMRILALVPGLNALTSWQRGVLIHVKRTRVISQAVMLNVMILAAVMLGAGTLLPVAGVITASLAMTSAMAVEWGYLWWHSRPLVGQLKIAALKQKEVLEEPWVNARHEKGPLVR